MTVAEATSDVDPELLAVARALTPLIEAEADRSEAQGTMTQAVVDAVAEAGLFWIMVPTEVGGLGANIATCLAVFEELAYADGSAGWSVMANATSSCFAAVYLDDAAVEAMFGGGQRAIHGGMFAPVGHATAVDEGFVVDGDYRFGSGTAHAAWIAAGVMEMEDGEPAVTDVGLPAMTVTFLPRDQVSFLDNWDVMGLVGTGSYDYRVDHVVVPERFTFRLLEATARRGGPTHGIGLFGLTAAGHAGFALGVGRRGLDEILRIARVKARLGGDPIADQQLFQHDFALHDAAVRAAHGYVLASFRAVEAVVADGGSPTNEQQQRLRQSTTWATRVSADACRFAYTWAGSDGLKNPSVVQRCFRDISAGTQHLFVDNNTLANYTHGLLNP